MYRNAFLLLIASLLLLCSCEKSGRYVRIEGFAQGGTYHVICAPVRGVGQQALRAAIDSRLQAIDFSLSGYNKGSLLSRLNAGEDLPLDSLFIECFTLSKAVWAETDGAFDPSAAPLFDLWGFGFTNKERVTDRAVDSVRAFVGMDRLRLETREDGTHLVREDPRMKLNFNAVAQGYSCDVVARYLDSLGCRAYLVDIGREIICKGLNEAGTAWRIGLDKPTDGNMEEGRDLQAILEVSDCGIVTSGNYRKFYIENGQKYAHTIDPKTGRPVSHNLLSATVVAKDAATADAYATWLMVVGVDKARAILSGRPDLEALLVYEEDGQMRTYQTDKIKTQ
ncbi:MAG: FAD:protein FMN transferase [Bacteroidales bacterium]|nr:FAD:protein FMN transferase [Bacteroidales bacterium]